MSVKTTDWTRLKAYCSVAEAWNAAGISYAVMTGLVGYPCRAGRDIDVLLASHQLGAATELARRALENCGYSVVSPDRLRRRRLVAVMERTWATAVQVHLLTALEWEGVTLQKSPEVTSSVGPFKLDPWATWAKGVLVRLMRGDYESALRYHNWVIGLSPSFSHTPDKLKELIGGSTANWVWNRLGNQGLGALEELRAQLKQALLFRAARHNPLVGVRGSLLRLRRRVWGAFTRYAPIVAVVGPDGVGKTTVLRILAVRPSVFIGAVIRHWRPDLLPALGCLLAKGEMQPSCESLTAPRRRPGHGDALRTVYYGLDYWLGYWLRDRPEAGSERLVLYDRHAIDMMADPVRYGLRSARIAKIMARIVPRPDLIVALAADPWVVVERKPQLSVEEVETQNAAWSELYRQGRVDAVLDASRPPEDVAEDLRRLIMAKFIAMHSPK